jgi:uncharacterized protein
MGEPLSVGASASRGRKVVSDRAFESDEIVHVAQVITVPENEIVGALKAYDFEWSDGVAAIALGLGSLFNHSANPNMSITKRLAQREIEFRAKRHISAWEELTFDYGYEPEGYDNG